MMALVLRQRVTFCYVLFTALIILDILAAMGAIAPLLSKESEDLAIDNNQTTVGNKTEADDKGRDWLSKEGVEEATTVSVEVFLSAYFLSILVIFIYICFIWGILFWQTEAKHKELVN